jgi:hypothetical protein
MGLWNAWTDLLQEMLQTLAVNWGFGAGFAIIVLTAAVRTAMMPLTWSLAYRAAVRQAKIDLSWWRPAPRAVIRFTAARGLRGPSPPPRTCSRRP